MDVAVVTREGVGVDLVAVRDSPAGLVEVVSGRLVDPVSVLAVGDLLELAGSLLVGGRAA